MNDSHHRALGQYRTVDAYGAATGDRIQLISRLMQGATDRLVTARGHMVRGEMGPKGEHLTRAVAIIDGLRVSLDQDKGGEIARNLDSLYDYMIRQLTVANLRNDPRIIDEVVELLGEIREGWESMATTVNLKPDAAPPAVDTARDTPRDSLRVSV
jgi:flagellar protein FliS